MVISCGGVWRLSLDREQASIAAIDAVPYTMNMNLLDSINASDAVLNVSLVLVSSPYRISGVEPFADSRRQPPFLSLQLL
jgi:hypothetical protein